MTPEKTACWGSRPATTAAGAPHPCSGSFTTPKRLTAPNANGPGANSRQPCVGGSSASGRSHPIDTRSACSGWSTSSIVRVVPSLQVTATDALTGRSWSATAHLPAELDQLLHEKRDLTRERWLPPLHGQGRSVLGAAVPPHRCSRQHQRCVVVAAPARGSD